MCAAVLGAWLGNNAHNHVLRLRALVEWPPPYWDHLGIKDYIKATKEFMWELRRQSDLHLLQKSFINLESLRERLRTFEPGRAFTDRWGCLWERLFWGTGFVFSR